MLPESNFEINNNQNNDNLNNNVNQNINLNQNNNAYLNNANTNITPSVEPNNENFINVSNNNSQNVQVPNEQIINKVEPVAVQKQDDSKAGQTNALMAYFGPLVFIPYFQEKENPFVLFHVKQGMNLFIVEVIVVVILEIIKFLLSGIIFWVVSIIDFLCGAFVIGLSLIGIYYVLEGKMEKIPIIGDIKIIK